MGCLFFTKHYVDVPALHRRGRLCSQKPLILCLRFGFAQARTPMVPEALDIAPTFPICTGEDAHAPKGFCPVSGGSDFCDLRRPRCRDGLPFSRAWTEVPALHRRGRLCSQKPLILCLRFGFAQARTPMLPKGFGRFREVAILAICEDADAVMGSLFLGHGLRFRFCTGEDAYAPKGLSRYRAPLISILK